MDMFEFVYGKCEATKDRNHFLDQWFETNKRPCTKCRVDKSKCNFYKTLEARGNITDDNP